MSIPSGLTRDRVLKAIADLDAGAAHNFGPPAGDLLIYQGKNYSPRAVVALACRDTLGRVLEPHEISDGIKPGQASHILRSLDFFVTYEQPAREERESRSGDDWAPSEVRLIVADYFAMLEDELLERPYVKAEHSRALIPQLYGRSKQSIEFKHCNISAILIHRGLPYIDGYKPRGNFQAMLEEEVESYLDGRPDFLPRIESAPVINPTSLPAPSYGDVFDTPPEAVMAPKRELKPWLSRRGRRIDFAERDARNRNLGKLGEEFVMELERQRLLAAKRDDLAQRVLWASRDLGDGLGYDIRSFNEESGDELLLEVKTTGLGKFFPFYVTSTEVRCSEDVPDQFRLYRVFDFGRSPRLYILPGALPNNFRLDPVSYRAVI